MNFHSILTKIIAFTVLSILLASMVPLYLSVKEYSNWYRFYVFNNLESLSVNMSEDLLSLVASDAGEFELTNFLLKLERYSNVRYARVYNSDYQLLAEYNNVHKKFDKSFQITYRPGWIEEQKLGSEIVGQDVLSLRMIGDKAFPQGYLLIVTDYQGPLDKAVGNMFSAVSPYALIVTLVVVLIVFTINRALLTPLVKLSRFTNKIADEKDYSLRADSEGKSEVADLSNNINRLLSTIGSEIERNKAQNKQLLEQQKSMERLANYDSLTGLPNRQFFMELLRLEIKKARRAHSDVAVMFFDLDGFKAINDGHGHETGDLLLIEVAKRISASLRDEDIIARLGGDEFLILINDYPDHLTLVQIAERILREFEQPFEVNNWLVHTGASIGIASASVADFNLSVLISNADLAMYRSKNSGRGTYTIFRADMLEDNKRRLLMANNLSLAVQDNEFNLVYQPKVDIAGKVVGFEALIRWNSSELGLVSPSEFILVAEQTGKIGMITQWLIRQCCHDLKHILAIAGEHVIVSLNLSTLDIRNEQTIQILGSSLLEYNVSVKNLELEITESAYLENFEEANSFFEKIRTLGMKLSLDDFGTGYSSLGYLTQLPIHTLKVDKQFVDNLGLSNRNTLVTKTIVEMATNLGLEVCAEGVETREQFHLLKEYGVTTLQGYYFSKPVPLYDLPKVVARLNA